MVCNSNHLRLSLGQGSPVGDLVQAREESIALGLNSGAGQQQCASFFNHTPAFADQSWCALALHARKASQKPLQLTWQPFSYIPCLSTLAFYPPPPPHRG